MLRYERVPLAEPDRTTSLRHRWDVLLDDGRRVPWRGFYTGPLKLAGDELDELCRKLLATDSAGEKEAASRELRPITAHEDMGPALIMHSASAGRKALEGDLDKLIGDDNPADYTTYHEARSVYLARPGDLAVGRTSTWKTTADLDDVPTVEIPNIDYYYLSDALLLLAERHLSSPAPQIDRMVELLRTEPNPVVRVYALERGMQIFLIWLKRLVGLETLVVDCNGPEIARAWSRKSMLYPRVRAALAFEVSELGPHQILDFESRFSPLASELGLSIPVLPGYTLERSEQDLHSFVGQAIQAARLLRQRYDLGLGCLKAAEGGDGVRITTGVDLGDEARIEALARDAYQHGDDYVLEAQVKYTKVNVGGQTLQTALCSYIRRGRVADGFSCQITEGTTWKGNVHLDESSAESFGVSQIHYRMMREAMESFVRCFQEKDLGLTVAGIDFALGRIGGAFGNDMLLAVQDPNLSFHGGECLRVFMDKVRERRSLGTSSRREANDKNEPLYGVTRVIRPTFRGPLAVLRAAVTESGSDATVITSMPGRWGVMALAAEDPAQALEKISDLHDSLIRSGLVE